MDKAGQRSASFREALSVPEFVVLLPGVDNPMAVRVAEHIRQTITTIVLPITTHHGNTVTFRGLTASIGIATYPQHGDMFDQLLRAADHALYAATNAGRNQLPRSRAGQRRTDGDYELLVDGSEMVSSSTTLLSGWVERLARPADRVRPAEQRVPCPLPRVAHN